MRAIIAGGPVILAIALASHISATAAHAPHSIGQRDAASYVVRIPHRVLADGKELPPAVYEVRLTDEMASPVDPGGSPGPERWVEFTRAGQVLARELATVVSRKAVAEVAKGSPPQRGRVRAETLRGREYFRIWINGGDEHYLVYLPLR